MFWLPIARLAFKQGMKRGFRSAYRAAPRSGYTMRTGQWHRRGYRYYRTNRYGEITGKRNYATYWGGKAAPWAMTGMAPYAWNDFNKRTRNNRRGYRNRYGGYGYNRNYRRY